MSNGHDSASGDPKNQPSIIEKPANASPEPASERRDQQPHRIGILWGSRSVALHTPGSLGQPAYGAAHANQSLIDAALTYLPQPIAVYARPSSLDFARQHVQAITHRYSLTEGERIVEPILSLARDWSKRRLSLWFNPTGDISSFLHFRSALGSSEVPIVSVHHTISYRVYLQVRFLMLMLARPRPFDAIICTSRAARQAVENALGQTAEHLARTLGMNVSFKGKLPILPLTVDTDTFSPGEKEPARAALGLNNRDFIVLFLGRVSPTDKGDLLPWLQALRRVPASLQERLVVVLAGRQEPEATAEIKKFAEGRPAIRLDLRGVVPEHIKPTLYSAADVFISPADSVQEMFGMAPLEAMACGLPQIVSDWDGYRDLIVDGETGFLIPTAWAPCTAEVDVLSLIDAADWHETHFSMAQSVATDRDLFVARIKQMIENPELRARMSRASRERAVKLFSRPVVMRRYSELFDSLIDESQHSTNRSEEDKDRFHLQPHYFDLFGHFASRVLTSGTRLRASVAGRFEDSEWAARLPYPGFQDLDLGILKLMAGVVEANDGCLAVEKVIELCRQSNPDMTQSLAWRHLMWLIKYGFITVL